MKNQENEKLTKLLGAKPQTQEQIANELGISPSALCQYKKGTRFPKREVAVKIANYLGVTVEELFYA